jgi:FolB domain-containing protein
VAVTDEAIEKIKDMITSGALRAGDRLPREADLAADLGLSRNSLREAVRALSLVNILDVRRGDGTYVTSLEPRLLLEALSFIVDFHRDDTLLEFLRVRRILEPAATAMAAERITEEECQGLRDLLDRVGADPKAEDLVQNDLEFHRRIVSYSGNSVLASLLEFLRVRRILESAATATAAERITAAESEGLRALLDSIGPDPAAEALVQLLVDGAHRRRRAVAGLGTVSGTDTVSVRDLSVRAVIGVHEWERAIEQTLVFNVDMVADVRTPAASDDLADALDYSAVAAAIAAVVREGKFRLIETAAERVAERLLADHGLAWLRLEVRKPITAPTPYTAAITIERTS